jgi:S1-C subfamily serine protease
MAAMPSSPSTPKQAIARMRSSIVSIHQGDATQPIGSGVVVRGRNERHGIVATALHVVREVAADELQIGFPVPPNEQARGGLTMLGATVVATDEGNDLALLEMERDVPLTRVTVAELEAERPEDGEDVMISGFPLGYRHVVNSAGIIACAWGDQGIEQTLDDAAEGIAANVVLDRYLVDINVNPGNSGGPCYRVSDQRVLGICEALELIEVDFEDNRPEADEDPALTVEDPQREVLQKADITFVIPAKYVIALLDRV